jgi:spore germination cell wall hydrolase CwlJ-like protein
MKVLLLTLFVLLSWTGISDPKEVQHYIHRAFVTPINYSQKDLRCMTQAVYYEAGNQSQLGKEAVATVVVNRVRSPYYPKTVCRVVFQSYRGVCQFSFACEHRRNPDPAVWKESKIIAQRVLQNYYHRDIVRKLDHALYFHADYVRPYWSGTKRKLTKIGQHIFYS